MTDYPITQNTFISDGYDGATYTHNGSGDLDGVTADIEYDAPTGGAFPTYEWYADNDVPWYDDAAIMAAIIGIRIDFTVTSGTGEFQATLRAENPDAPETSTAQTELTASPGAYSLDLGTTLPWYSGGALSIAEVLRRSSHPSYERTSGWLRLLSGGPMSVAGFAVVAYTAAIPSLPPLHPSRRLLPTMAGAHRRLWPPPTSMQESPGGIGNHL